MPFPLDYSFLLTDLLFAVTLLFCSYLSSVIVLSSHGLASSILCYCSQTTCILNLNILARTPFLLKQKVWQVPQQLNPSWDLAQVRL